jgi:DNA-binding CsgD family transcriptional regulator
MVALLGVGCAVLSESFSSLDRSTVRLAFETLALGGCGLFVAELIRNRRMSPEAQERLRALVETSPAAIVTVDERGFIELADRAAIDLIAPRDGYLIGYPIAGFLRTAACVAMGRGPPIPGIDAMSRYKADGETFLAEVWFSTYKEGHSPKLAAIIADITEKTSSGLTSSPSEYQGKISLSQREVDVLRLVVQGLTNKEIAARLETSESTVKNTLQQLFTKSGVRTRGQLVRVALEHHRNLL